ncbi:MAG: helix-turn-helix transcriptional regulator [Rhizobiaceae bacterium]|nr:helix-turn-helix transcriptional regulator [Rhizobiaceae bacterium]
MTGTSRAPHANTKLAIFLRRRILELRPRKSQIDIAAEVGWRSRNILSMIAGGSTKLPIDRVPALARALDVDAARLLQLALEQHDTMLWPIVEEVCGMALTENERKIVSLIRTASGGSDPAPTGKLLRALREAFGE